MVLDFDMQITRNEGVKEIKGDILTWSQSVQQDLPTFTKREIEKQKKTVIWEIKDWERSSNWEDFDERKEIFGRRIPTFEYFKNVFVKWICENKM